MSAEPVPPLFEPPPEEPQRQLGWKKVVVWTTAGLALLMILVVVAAVVLLRNARFQQYLLRTAEQKTSEALGAQVQARSYTLHWSGVSPSVDLYDVVVYGAPPYARPPLLQADHIGVSVRIVSLLRRTWYLNEVRVDHPVARVFFDQNGRDNLPQTKSTGQSRTSVFDLGVRHAILDRGEIYYNDRKSLLNADLHDLAFQAGFDPAKQQYSGTLSYRNGHLQYGNYRPMAHNLDARFDATPTRFVLHHTVLASRASQFVLDATVENYSQPRVQATYAAVLDAGEFRRIMEDPSLPTGVIRAAGSLQYQSVPNQPMLETAKIAGDLNSRGLQVQSGTVRANVTDIVARYNLANGNLDVPDVRARLLGGTLTGAMTIRNLSGASQSHLRAKLRGVSLAELKPLMNSPSMQQVALDGLVNADADATWGKTTNNLIARTDATIQAKAAPNSAPSGSQGRAVPLNGVIHARYAAVSKQLTLSQSYLRMPQTSLTLDGTVSNRSALEIRLQSNDLHELDTVAQMFITPAPGQPVQPLGLYGTAAFTGAVRGSTSAPNLAGQLTASNLRVKGTSWKVLRTNVDMSPSGASLKNGNLEAVPQGRITFNLSTGLKKWSYTNSSPIQVSLNASQLNVAELAKMAGVKTPMDGTLAASISLHGSELNPVGNGTVTLTRTKVLPIQRAKLDFKGTSDQVQGNLAVDFRPGAVHAVFAYFPKQQGYQAQVEGSAIQLNQFRAVKTRNTQMSGVLNLKVSGQGTFKNPQLTASIQVPRLTVQNQTISGLSLDANVANHVGNFALNSEAVNTQIRGRGTVNLTDGYYTQATFDTQSIPLQPLVAMFAPAQGANVSGQTEIHATLRGPIKNKALIDAHLTIPTLQVNYKDTVQIGAVNPIRIDYAGGVLTLQRAALRGTGTDLQFQGRVPVTSQAPASLLLLGNIDLRLAQLIDPDVASSGQIQFNINSFGNRANPNVQGQVRIVNANLATGSVPIGLQNSNGVLTLTKDRLEITQFEGTVGGGTVTARGGIIYRPSLQFDLALSGRGVRMLYPEGMREQVDTNLTLTGNTQASQLGGHIRIDQLSFTPDFDLSNFINQFTGETAPPPAQGFADNLQLNLTLQSTNAVALSSRELSLNGTANLKVTGTASQPIILGRVNLTGGDLIFNGNRYVLEGGTIDFVNPTQTQPNVNLAVTTTIQQYNIRMQFQGPIDHLHTNYTSDPALPPSDVISLLAFGKTSEASAANPAPGNLGAESLVASQVSGQVTNRLQRIAGISHLSVDPLLSCNQQTQGSCVTVQQRVTSQIYVTFSTDVTATQTGTMELQYQPNPRVTLSGTRDYNGGFGFDARIHKDW